ncbi:ABC transporter substrate-binding protein [uncultured Brachyspira sp.]|uniref:ABC transporter substrate-binding protein n=1 Tax=uncultured Brachyspira sp. TaxID=221953 RepID=UPI00259B9CB5|nr:ABC transporter substrate-binding protein [uncultured Brachyspira sp.]
MLKKIIKKISALLFAVSVSALIFGCSNNAGGSEVGQGKRIKIAMSFQEMKNQYFVVMAEAFEEAGKSIGAEIFTADAGHDVVKQISDVEDLLQRDIDILIINPTDSQGIRNAVVAAKQKGVIVVAVDAQAEGGIDSFVGSKNYDAGYLAGEHLAKTLNGSGEVAILDGIPVVPILERVKGFREAIAKYPNIKIVALQNGRQERDYALTVAENMIQANPNLKGIFSVNDEGSLGVLRAIQSSEKDIKLVSVDGNPEAIEAIKSGNIFIGTAAQFPRDQVRVGIGIALAKYWGAHIPEEIPIPVELITKENAEGFSW